MFTTTFAGDTIRIDPGRYAGGVVIRHDLSIVGSGASVTRISGGGPVLTVGMFGATTEPSVHVRDLTVSDGRTTTGPIPGARKTVPIGGGILVPPSANFGAGGTLSADHVVIENNAVEPEETAPVGPPCPGGTRCPFGSANGGGIDSWGTLILRDSVVRGNRVGPHNTSDANGAGTRSVNGLVRLTNTDVLDNMAIAKPPFGRFADCSGVFLINSSLDMSGGSIRGNVAWLTSDLPASVEQVAQSGAMHLANDSSATIVAADLSGNRVIGTFRAAGAAAIVYAGAIGADVPGSLSIKNTTIRDNAVQAIATGSASGQPGAFLAASGALDLSLQRTISRTTISGNTVSATAHAGLVLAVSGAVSGIAQAHASVSISASLLEQNHVSAVSTHGTAFAYGGATQNSAPMLLTDVTVSGTTVTGW